MSEQKDSGGWGGATGAPETWEQFDALPVGVKRVFWSAPYAYSALSTWRAMGDGLDMRAVARALRAQIARDVRREARRLYGPDHPQAET